MQECSLEVSLISFWGREMFINCAIHGISTRCWKGLLVVLLLPRPPPGAPFNGCGGDDNGRFDQ